MSVTLTDEQVETARAILEAFAANTSEPYNAVNEFLNIPSKERDPTGGEAYDEDNDPVVQRIISYAHAIGATAPEVEGEEPEKDDEEEEE